MKRQQQIEKLTYAKFLESLRLCPRLTVELLIENNKKEILLLKRTSPPFKNYWHLPGGFLLKGESIEQCIKRISNEEVCSTLYKKDGKFVTLFENLYSDPRGHLLHYIIKFKSGKSFLETLTPLPKGNKQFFKMLPKMIPYQRNFLKKIGY